MDGSALMLIMAPCASRPLHVPSQWGFYAGTARAAYGSVNSARTCVFVTVAVIAFATPVSGFVTDRQPRTMVAFTCE